MNSSSPSTRRRLQGVVTSAAMKDTVVVRIDRRVADKKYGKYFTVSKKFKVHDPQNTAHVGDVVDFEECRPISRDKRWRLIATVSSAVQSA